MKRILAIWFPSWPIQRLVSTRPELRRQAVVLHDDASGSRAGRGRRVAACSPMARKLGVHEDMPLVEATALVRGKSDHRKGSVSPLHLECYAPQADRQALQKLARWCHQYSPCVGLEEGENPESLLLDVTATATCFGGECRLIDQVARSLEQLRLTAQVALADTVGAAWAVSHYGCQNPNRAETNIVEAGDSNSIVASLPLAALRLPAAMTQTLARLGIQQIGQLLEIPRAELKARFSALLLTRIDQALGIAAEVINATAPPTEFVAHWQLEYPIDRRDAIDQVIQQLVRRLSQRLTAAGEGALRLVCQLNCHPAPTLDVEIGLFQPSADAEHLLELLRTQMEQIKLPGPVNGVQVRVTQHATLAWRQQGLFDQEQRQSDSPQVALLVDRLTSRLGREAVLGCRLRSDAQPEKAYRQQPLVDPIRRQKKSRLTSQSFGPLDRPLHLLTQPTAVDVIAIAPEGSPSQLRFHGQVHKVARHWGPERIETGWWRRRGIQRDYYRVETQAGHRFWLFRHLRTGSWFLQGIFG